MRARPFGWFRLAWQQILLAVRGVSETQSTLTNSSFTGASGTLTYTARDASGAVMAGVPVVFTVDAEALISASLSVVTASPTEITNNGVEASTISLALVDTDADPVVGFATASAVLAVSGANNTVTQPASVSTVAGLMTGSFVSTGAAAKTASFTTASLAITDTAAVTVSGTSDEPVYDSGTDTLLMGGRDGTFDTYADTAAMRAAWTTRGTSATLITPGESGAGKACRFTIPVGAGEVDYGLELYFGGTVSDDLVVTFDFRPSSGADFTSGRFGSSGTKWVLLYRDYNGGSLPRCTLGVMSLQDGILAGPADDGVQFEFRDQSVTAPGSILQNVSKSVGWDTTNSEGTTNRTSPVNNALWHRYTVRARPADDYAEIWIDGVKTNSSVGLTYAMSDTGFDAIAIAGPIVPDVLTGYDFTLDIDNLEVFTKGA